MVKSVDPDQTTSVTERTNEAHEDVDLQEGMEDEDEEVAEYEDRWGETTSAAPVILEESGTLPTHTGTIDYFNTSHGYKELFAGGLLSKPMGQTRRCHSSVVTYVLLRCAVFLACSLHCIYPFLVLGHIRIYYHTSIKVMYLRKEELIML